MLITSLSSERLPFRYTPKKILQCGTFVFRENSKRKFLSAALLLQVLIYLFIRIFQISSSRMKVQLLCPFGFMCFCGPGPNLAKGHTAIVGPHEINVLLNKRVKQQRVSQVEVQIVAHWYKTLFKSTDLHPQATLG